LLKNCPIANAILLNILIFLLIKVLSFGNFKSTILTITESGFENSRSVKEVVEGFQLIRLYPAGRGDWRRSQPCSN